MSSITGCPPFSATPDRSTPHRRPLTTTWTALKTSDDLAIRRETHHPSAGSRMAYDDYRARRGPFSAHDAPPLQRLTIRQTRVESLPIVTRRDALQHLRQYCLTVQKARRPVGRARRRRSRRRGHVRSHRRVGAHPVHRRRFALLSANGGRRQWGLSRHA